MLAGDSFDSSLDENGGTPTLKSCNKLIEFNKTIDLWYMENEKP